MGLVLGVDMEGASLASAAMALSGEEGSKKGRTLDRDGQKMNATVTVSSILKRMDAAQ